MTAGQAAAAVAGSVLAGGVLAAGIILGAVWRGQAETDIHDNTTTEEGTAP